MSRSRHHLAAIGLALLAPACAGPTPAPRAPAPATVSAPAPSPPKAEPDRSRVPAPPSLVAVARVARPQSSQRDIGQWSSGRLSLDTPFGRFGELIDSDAPVDFAVSMRLRTFRLAVEPQLLASAAVRDDRAILARAAAAGLAALEVAPGVVQLGQGEDPTCLLVPSARPEASRLVCSDVAPDITTAGYLARTLPEEDLGDADLVVELRSGDVAERLAGVPPVRGLVLSEADSLSRRKLPQMSTALQPVLPALVEHAFELAQGTDKVRIELRQLAGGLTEMRSSFWPRGDGAWLWRTAAVQREHAAVAPPSFWRLLPVADAIWFSTRIHEERYRELRDGLVDLFARIIADTPAARDTADLVVRSMLPHGPVLHAHGDTTQEADPEHGNPYVRARAVSFFGWHIVGVESTAAEVERDLVGGMEAYNDGRLERLAHRAIPQLCSGLPPIKRRQATAGWPKGTVLFEMRFPPQFFEQCGSGWAAHRGAVPALPLVVTVALVPEGKRSWVGVSADDKRLAAVFERLLSNAPGLSATPDPLTDPLSRNAVMSGGVVTLGAVESTLAHVGSWTWRATSQSQLSATGHSSGVWWWSAPEAEGSPVTFTARVPAERVMLWLGTVQGSRRYRY